MAGRIRTIKPEILESVTVPPPDFSYGSKRTYVYFMQASPSGAIKIGTAWNVRYRLTSVQTGNHEEVRLVAWVLGDRSLERQLHQEFANHHIRGEWFRSHDELIRYIRIARACGGQ